VRRRVPRRRMDAHPSTTSSCPGPPRRSPACPRPLGTRRLDPGGRACLRPPKVRGARVLATRASSVLTACRKGGDALRLDPSHVSLNPRDRRRRAPPHALGRGILPKHAPPPRRPLAVGSPPGDPRRGLRTGDGALPTPSPPFPRPSGPEGRGGRRRGRPLPFGPSAPQGGPSEGLRRAGGPSPRAAPSDAALGVRGRPRPWGVGMRRALARPWGVGVPSGSRACRGRGRGAPPSARVAAEGGPRGGVRRRRIPVVPPMSCPPREDRGVSPGAATLAARIGSPGAPPGRPASRPDPVHGLACAPGPALMATGPGGTAPGARRAPLARGGRLPTPP